MSPIACSVLAVAATATSTAPKMMPTAPRMRATVRIAGERSALADRPDCPQRPRQGREAGCAANAPVAISRMIALASSDARVEAGGEAERERRSGDERELQRGRF